MTNELTTAEKIRKLPWSLGANAALTVFIQLTFFGSVFVLFLGSLKLDKTQIGFLLSLIPFADTIALFIAPTVARFGYKRIYVTFFGIRSGVAALLLLTPWALSSYGAETTLIFITGVVALFALCRSIGVTAAFPWIQEYIPNSVRGKFSATNNIFMGLVGFVTVTGAGIVLERTTGLRGFMILIAIGVVFGFIAVWAASHIPGGAPVQASAAFGKAFRDLTAAMRDRGLLRYLFGAGCMTLAIVPLNSFVPLFLREQVGIRSGNVVLIQTGVLLGGLLSTYLWGWTADRYGSRPIMLSGATLRILLPILWILMPRNSIISLYVALGIALLQGIADMGWVIGSTRLLYVSVVPAERKTEYMALYSAWVGVVSGVSQLLGGQIIQLASGISGRFLIFTLDPYTGLFILGIILPIAGNLVLRKVRADTEVRVEEFAGLFLRGNPILAMTSLVEYHLWAKDEKAVIHITERLGQTKSPLTVEELLDALADPRFNVRFEAMISIARTRQDPRLTQALISILNGTELALSVVAAWALGRIGDPAAREALRAGIDSEYRSIQAHCARALGTLGDYEIAPLLLERLEHESDKGVQMAYASALGKLKAEEGVSQLLSLLKKMENEGARMELALSLARLVGDESPFIRVAREARVDMGTAMSQAVITFKKTIGKDWLDGELLSVINDCADRFARDDMDQGIILLSRFIELLPSDRFNETSATILRECASRMAECGSARLEYILLALHVIERGQQT
jgi:Na+/melibiose symporter-like transporter